MLAHGRLPKKTPGDCGILNRRHVWHLIVKNQTFANYEKNSDKVSSHCYYEDFHHPLFCAGICILLLCE